MSKKCNISQKIWNFILVQIHILCSALCVSIIFIQTFQLTKMFSERNNNIFCTKFLSQRDLFTNIIMQFCKTVLNGVFTQSHFLENGYAHYFRQTRTYADALLCQAQKLQPISTHLVSKTQKKDIFGKYRVSKIKIFEFKLLLLRNCALETLSW